MGSRGVVNKQTALMLQMHEARLAAILKVEADIAAKKVLIRRDYDAAKAADDAYKASQNGIGDDTGKKSLVDK